MARWLQQFRQRFKRRFVYTLALCAIILLGGGWGFWALDPAIDTFGDGVWLAFTTAATVGYGDMVPSTFASRLFAVVVFLLGLTVLSLATSALTAFLSHADEAAPVPPAQEALLQEIKQLQTQMQQMQATLAQVQQSLPRASTPSDPP